MVCIFTALILAVSMSGDFSRVSAGSDQEKYFVKSIEASGESYFFLSVTNISLNGGGNAVEVKPGETVKGTLNYQVWNPSTCPQCIAQIVVGLENTPIACVYNGIPGLSPGKLGTGSFTLTAPKTEGEYRLYYTYSLQYTCDAALAEYNKRTKTQIGTVRAKEQCNFYLSVNDVSLNNGGSFITVKPGGTVKGTLRYQLWNPSTCPQCIAQIVVGLDNTPISCVYNGIPGTCPGKSGTGSFQFTAPTDEGPHYLYYTYSLQYTCNAALAEYNKRPKTLIATVRMRKDQSNFYLSVSNANLNGKGSSVTVKPGEQVNVALNYQLWNPSTCPGCIVQIVVGLNNNAKACVYNGIPGVYPGKSGTGSFQFTAPTTEGEYRLYYTYSMQYTCDAALAEYNKRTMIQIGTIKVKKVQPSIGTAFIGVFALLGLLLRR